MNKKIIPFIAINKNIYYKYFIEDKFEAGLSLQGWEVKALRAGNVIINNSYVLFKNNEAYLFGANFKSLGITSSYVFPDPIRNRKLLLNQRELDFIYSKVHQKGYTVVVISMYWKYSFCKIEIGVAKGKKEYDKRIHIKDREWKLTKERIIKKHK
ncbi:SsrA-binding protein [Candidatus Providencia siddallii]|uniref:SsrA-binding protein n=1 Tax=Candidatus Providencia siddallii TaxID=1715285 RepID=A0A0M6W767_9GAMM|nr:SsrA-binding protein [Candidatus Providencia siddallii]